MSSTNFSQIAAFLWSVADLLRGDFKQSQYGRIILPFTLLRRLECVLETTKDAVIAEAQKVKAMKLPEEAQEKMILRATNGLTFFNASAMDLSKMAYRTTWKTTSSRSLRMPAKFSNTSSSASLSDSWRMRTYCSKWCKYSLKQIYTRSTSPTTIWGWYLRS